MRSITHTHTRITTCSKHTPTPPSVFPSNPPAPPSEKYSECVVPRLKFLSAYKTAFQFLYCNPLKARPIDRHKIFQLSNSESVRCPCSRRSERLLAPRGPQGGGGTLTQGRERAFLLSFFIVLIATSRRDDRFTVW